MANDKETSLPYANTTAAKMLQAALFQAAEEKGLSTRAVARALGYKATVVISHMATGRVPIPLERAAEIAEAVGLDVPAFFEAVLEQRHPGSIKILGLDGATQLADDDFADELRLIAGCALASLSDEHKSVLREAVSESQPARRWLALPELPAILTIRRYRPRFSETGLSRQDMEHLAETLRPT